VQQRLRVEALAVNLDLAPEAVGGTSAEVRVVARIDQHL
jgi:hypothetical protein